MKVQKRIIFALLVAVFGFTAGAAAAGRRDQGQSPATSPALEKAKEDFYTVADYAAPLPSEPRQRAIRLARNRRFNIPKENLYGADASLFALTERRESSFGGFPSHAEPEPALPAGGGDAVVIGEVEGARAYLSEDKANVYSEFAVRINDVLKNSPASPLSPGDSTAMIRFGGGVRFPSGKVIRVGFGGKPLPRRGLQYLFCLRHNEAEQDYLIVTAYELRSGRVIPLDGIDLDGSLVEELSAHQKYSGADEGEFLRGVREAIAGASQNRPE
jgi:hypothetical protein